MKNHIKTKTHFKNCWICKTNEDIYKISEGVKVSWNEKKNIDSNLMDPILFKESLKIEFYKENQLVFSLLIRTTIKHSEYPLLICSKKMYKRSFTLEYLKKFRTLNSFSIRKIISFIRIFKKGKNKDIFKENYSSKLIHNQKNLKKS